MASVEQYLIASGASLISSGTLMLISGLISKNKNEVLGGIIMLVVAVIILSVTIMATRSTKKEQK